MSRLNSHKQKEYKKRVVLLAVLLVGLIIFMALFGLKLLINTSIFISNITGGETQNVSTASKKEDFFGSFDISSIPTATNSAQIEISGYITDYDKVEFYINDEKVKETSAFASDSFDEQIGDLKEGNNTVYMKVSTKKGDHTKESEKYTVLYSQEKPKLEIRDPKDNSQVNTADITINGTTDKNVSLRVNNMPGVVDANGEFKYALRLKDGENKIEVEVEDTAGNTENKTLTVTYRKDN